MQFLTAIKHFEIQIILLFLLAIADLIHPLSNNRSSIGMIGCSMEGRCSKSVAPVAQLVTSQPSDTLGREFESR